MQADENQHQLALPADRGSALLLLPLTHLRMMERQKRKKNGEDEDE
jgi:hypothetical protein